MYLYRLLYYSSAVDDPDIDEILETARELNSKNFVTGALWFDGRFFLQALEGTRDKISATYNRICRDDRHKDLVLVHCGPIYERVFTDWDMAFHDDNEKNREFSRRFMGKDYLDPRGMMPETMLGMLKGLNLTAT